MNLPQAVTHLAALAHETRLQVFRLLVQAGPEGLPAGVIADRLGLPPSTLSFHLKELAGAGLVQPTPQGRQVIYAVRIPVMRDLIGFLTENCCDGAPCGIESLAASPPLPNAGTPACGSVPDDDCC